MQKLRSTTYTQTVNMALPLIFLPVYQWRRLSSVPEDLFRSGGLPCGSLPATLPLLPKLWTHPGRQCQWEYTPCINTTHCLHSTLQHSLINLQHGLFGMHSFITTCLFGTVLCRYGNRSIYSHLSFSLPHLSCRGGLSEGCFMLLLSAWGRPAQGQAGVWVLCFFYAQIKLSDDLVQHFHFLFPFLFSCFQALWQRWQRSPRQLCKLLRKSFRFETKLNILA